MKPKGALYYCPLCREQFDSSENGWPHLLCPECREHDKNR